MEAYEPDKWSRPAMWQEQLSEMRVQCHLCPHECVLHPGQTGICRTRINHDGELYTQAYGNPCSISIDPIEKKPLFHFFPGSGIYSLSTAGCNFRCLNCQNWQISQVSPRALQHFDMSPTELVQQAIRHDTDCIAFTYTEPTVFYEYILDTASIAKEKGVKTVFISNGYINKKPLAGLMPWLDAANIDLKCFDDEVYHRLDGGRLQPVLETLKVLKAGGVWLEITNLQVPGYTDSPELILTMCEWLVENGFADTPLHFSRFFPTYRLKDLPPTSEATLIHAKAIAEKTGMKFIYVGNIPGLHDENTVCPACRQLLVERESYQVKSNYIHHGQCVFCGEPIPGVWE